MTRDEALRLLSLDANATPEKINSTLQAKRATTEQRQRNATTSILRNECRYQLEELDKAKNVLLGAEPSASNNKPSVQTTPNQTKSSTPGKAFTLLKSGQSLTERYRIEELIGHGSTGIVYLALDKEIYKHVVIKVLSPALFTQPQAREKFLKEAQLCKEMYHPNIASVFDIQQDGPHIFFCLELLKGESLRSYLKSFKATHKTMEVNEALNIIDQICKGLAYAHEKGIIHGDIRPENIWLTEKGKVKIMDFGMLKALSVIQPNADKVSYAAPEQSQDFQEALALPRERGGFINLDGRADQYAVAVMLTEMLTGNISIGHIESLDKLREDIPQSISLAITRAISAKREQRYPNILSFQHALTTSAFFSTPAGKLLGIILGSLLLGMGFMIYSFLTAPTAPLPKISRVEKHGYARIQSEYKTQLKLLRTQQQEIKDIAAETALTVSMLEQQLTQISNNADRSRLINELHLAQKQANLYQQIELEQRKETENIAALEGKLELADTTFKQGHNSEALSQLQAGITRMEQLREIPRQVERQVNGKIHELTQQSAISAVLDKPKSFRACSGCPEMVALPGGTFTMGSRLDEKGRFNDEAPHSVTIKRFALARYEVTRAEYELFVESSGYNSGPCLVWDAKAKKSFPAHNTSWEKPAYSTYTFKQTTLDPVVCVSYDDAQTYIHWLSESKKQHYRLPTEAEWEYAARATTQSARYWSNDEQNACGYANVMDQTLNNTGRFNGEYFPCTDGHHFTAPVGSFQANAFGLYDMLGNVWEWTCSVFSENYDGSELKCSDDNKTGTRRIFRGGSWYNGPRNVRSANRYKNEATYRYGTLGFRLAQDL